MQAMAKLHTVGYREDDVYLHCAPLFHIGGLSSMIAMLAVGATQVTHLPSRKNDRTHMSCAVRHRLALECLMNWLLLRCTPLMACSLSPWTESDDGQMMGKYSSYLTGCELAECKG